MNNAVDHYRSRLSEPAPILPRLEPVVHATRQQRLEGPLEETMLQQFERDGYLWLEGFCSQEEMLPFFDELKTLAARRDLIDSGQIIADPVNGDVRSVFGMHEISERFDQLTRDPRILLMVQQILGGDVYIHQSRINDKRGFQGSGFYWHSDFETWHCEDGMPRMRALSASLMLTDNNEFNGPLMLIPGSHRQFVPCVGKTPAENWKNSLKAQSIGVPDRTILSELADQAGIHAPKGPAGSLLLFDCNILHASNENMSPWPRSNLFFVYNSVENRLVEPFAAPGRRPEYLGARGNTEAIRVHNPGGQGYIHPAHGASSQAIRFS